MKTRVILLFSYFFQVFLTTYSFAQTNNILIIDKIDEEITYYELLTSDSILINSYVGPTYQLSDTSIHLIYSLSSDPISSFGDNELINSFWIPSMMSGCLPSHINVLECTFNTLSSKVKLNQKAEPFLYSMYGFDNLVLNTTNNSLYCGNLGLSNISVIQCSSEQRILEPGMNWISFPRLERNNQSNEPMDAIEFLDDNIMPNPSYLQLSNLPPNSEDPNFDIVFLTYINGTWINEGLEDIYSTRGYKLLTDNDDISTLSCDGTILSPDIDVDLFGPGKENWIGYFLPESRWAEDAFAEIWNYLTMIKTQYWTMARIDGQWFASSKVAPLNFGDLVIVRCVTNCSFHWNYASPAVTPKDYQKTTYFTYQELDDYIPVFIELDTADIPLEIGIFNDSLCLGAEPVYPGDTMIQINAYIDSTGQQLEFNFYYGTKNTPVSHPDYLVYDPVSKRMRRDKIITGNKEEWYWISFRNEQSASEPTPDEPIITINLIKPNPFGNRTEIMYTLSCCTEVSVQVVSLEGKTISCLLDGNQCPGTFSIFWNGTTTSGQWAEPGIYLLKINTPHQSFTEKLVYIR